MSLEMKLFDRTHLTSYSRSILALVCTVSEIYMRDIAAISQFFPTPHLFRAPLRRTPLNYLNNLQRAETELDKSP